MTRAEFDAAMPHEFWRDVVDRVAAEVPDTLLLAEAFWLMEGYFVRTLGMHRVYNSAFMHMLRDEDNAKYRLAIKNTLEFDPEILRRYVNFMNNPDEKTAVEQFGNGDKYFGVCTVLSTLPGLPMFGHGQIEGYREKYGMEFRMPKWDEAPDEGLIHGHEWKIFPLLHRRYLFAGVENFVLYDLFRDDGRVDENVFAYSNRSASGERGLIIYHNKFADTKGWIRISAAYLDKASGSLLQKSLSEALDLPPSGFTIFRDYVSHLEYIRSCAELREKGLFLQLGAYRHHAFLDWRFVDGADWRTLFETLNGRGVESIETEWQAMFHGRAEMSAFPEAAAPVKTPRRRQVGKRAARPAARKSEKKAKAVKAAAKSKPRARSSAKKSPARPAAKKSSRRKPARKSTTAGSRASKKP